MLVRRLSIRRQPSALLLSNVLQHLIVRQPTAQQLSVSGGRAPGPTRPAASYPDGSWPDGSQPNRS